MKYSYIILVRMLESSNCKIFAAINSRKCSFFFSQRQKKSSIYCPLTDQFRTPFGKWQQWYSESCSCSRSRRSRSCVWPGWAACRPGWSSGCRRKGTCSAGSRPYRDGRRRTGLQMGIYANREKLEQKSNRFSSLHTLLELNFYMRKLLLLLLYFKIQIVNHHFWDPLQITILWSSKQTN